jgi:hypothetical protein
MPKSGEPAGRITLAHAGTVRPHVAWAHLPTRLGAIVLAIVVPTTASGAEPVWPFVLAAVAVVILGILVGHRPPVRAWLRR